MGKHLFKYNNKHLYYKYKKCKQKMLVYFLGADLLLTFNRYLNRERTETYSEPS